jgi:DNA-binding Lrp family transcriptional regulator
VSGSLDEIDFRLLAKLAQGESRFGTQRIMKGSLKQFASELNLDEDTIRNRIKAFQKTGVLKGWEVHLNPSIIGCDMYLLWLDVDPNLLKSDVLKRIRMVHGVLGITDMISQTVVVQMLYRNEQSFQRSADLITEISSGKIIVSYKALYPASDFQPSPDDWRLIGELRKKPTGTYYELGKTIGLSSRAVRRRLEKLISSRAIAIIPKFEAKAIKGGIGVDMIVAYSNPDLKRGFDAKIASRLGHTAFRIGWGDARLGHFTFGASGMSNVREISDWVRTLGGVSLLRLDFICDAVSLPDAYDELIPRQRVT